MSRLILLLAALAMLFCIAAPLPADDFAQPWYRGGPLSVEVEWEFAQPPGNWLFIPPDTFNIVPGSGNEYIYPGFGPHAEVDLPSNWTWVPGDGDGGVMPIVDGASIGFKPINWVDEEPLKYLRVQVTYQGLMPSILYLDGRDDVANNPPTGVDTDWMFDPPVIVDANHFYQDFIIMPNPDWELIAMAVPNQTILDQVYIDTISLPEPSGVALLVLGAAVLALALRRRK